MNSLTLSRSGSGAAVLAALLLAACGPTPPDDDLRAGTPPPASAFMEMGESASLDTALIAMEEELTGLLADQLESPEGQQHLLRAEAISDRLLEAELPFARLASDSYSVEASLRQIQTLADRLVAQQQVASQFGSNVRREVILEDARDLLRRVRGLRQALTRGGTGEPVTLDQLLSGDSLAGRVAPPPNPALQTSTGPVGTPVPPPGD